MFGELSSALDVRRLVLIVAGNVAFGTLLGYFLGIVVVPWAPEFGAAFGTLIGALTSPILLLCLADRCLGRTLPLVYGLTTMLGFSLLPAGFGRFLFPLTTITLCGTCLILLWCGPAMGESPRVGLCRSCNYDLRGNVSGICPECGRPISAVTDHMNNHASPNSTRPRARITRSAIACCLTAMVLWMEWPRGTDRQSRSVSFTYPSTVPSENRATSAAWFQALEDEDKSSRANAVIALARSGQTAAIPQIRRLLYDRDYYVRERAIVALSILKDDGLMPALEAMLESKDSGVVLSAVRAAGAMGRVAEIPRLVSFVNHQDPTVRDSAVYAIATLDGQRFEQATWNERYRSARAWWRRIGEVKYIGRK